jgi:hypothetical protein
MHKQTNVFPEFETIDDILLHCLKKMEIAKQGFE